MKMNKALLIMILTVSCFALMPGPTVTAEQGVTQGTEESQSAGADCCQMKGAPAAGETQNGKSKSCCAHHEGSHGAQADADCCQMKGAPAAGQAQSEKGQSCCMNHEGSHGGKKAEEGSH